MATQGIPSKLLHLFDIAEETLQKSIIVTFGLDTLDLYQKLIARPDPQLLFKSMSSLKTPAIYQLSRALSISLELISACESAYRISLLRRKSVQAEPNQNMPYALTYVFTAHPTEARSPEIIHLFREIQNLLLSELTRPERSLELNLLPLISLALRLPVARSQKPDVEDEAIHIYSHILSPALLRQQLKYREQGLTVHFRTWVGGDKDGHPGVSEKTMLMSLGHSRQHLYKFVSDELQLFCDNFAKAHKLDLSLTQLLNKFRLHLKPLKSLRSHDGEKITTLHSSLTELIDHLKKIYGGTPSHLRNIENLLWLYPALVVPLELREDAELIKAQHPTISKMLEKLHSLSFGFQAKWYVRGLVVSMVQSSDDLKAAVLLMRKHLKKSPIPIVPLFETENALKNSVKILTEHLEMPHLLDPHKKLWSNRYEMMLGYSDSSKEIGVFASRLMITKSMHRLEKLCKKHQLQPVFFHGSGGSIERGGGSIEEQVKGWPKSALEIYKLTVQGETVVRNFSSAELMDSQVQKLLVEYNRKSPHRSQETFLSAALFEFIESTKRHYRELKAHPNFNSLLMYATPYLHLQELKMGSRPTARQTGVSGHPGQELKLRAIPWVLCWTQTRLLLPTWWGLGSAWFEIKDEATRTAIKQEFSDSPQLASMLKILGFTLDKTHFKVFEFYLAQSHIEPNERRKLHALIWNEFQLARKFYMDMCKGLDHSDNRPRLSQSIRLRRDQTTVLNVIQLIALDRKEMALFRETVTGIASGMMTTG